MRHTKTSIVLFGILLFMSISFTLAASKWTIYEESVIQGKISGKISHGYIFATISGNYYELVDYVYLYEYLYSPEVIVLKNDEFHKLIIEGIKEPLLCRKIGSNDNSKSENALESRIDGNFEGFEYKKIFKLLNGQIWQQIEAYYYYHYSYAPKILIYKSGNVFKVKVDGVDKAVTVIQLK